MSVSARLVALRASDSFSRSSGLMGPYFRLKAVAIEEHAPLTGKPSVRVHNVCAVSRRATAQGLSAYSDEPGTANAAAEC